MDENQVCNKQISAKSSMNTGGSLVVNLEGNCLWSKAISPKQKNHSKMFINDIIHP